jgi:hypothetical protein
VTFSTNFWAVALARGARLSSGDAAANAANLVDVVDSIGLFLEEILVEVAP